MGMPHAPVVSGQTKVLSCNGLILDLKRQEVVGHAGAQHLSPTECLLLATFMQHPRQVLSRRFLMKQVWYTDFVEDTRVLEVYVCVLRRKIEVDRDEPRYLVTVRGVGYRFGPVD